MRTLSVDFAGYEIECEITNFVDYPGNGLFEPPEHDIEFEMVGACQINEDGTRVEVDIKSVELTDKQQEDLSNMLYELIRNDAPDYPDDDWLD